MKGKTLLWAAMFAFALPGIALAAHGKAGLWNVSTTMTMAMPNIPPEALAQMQAMGMTMPAGGQTFTAQVCMTEADVESDRPPSMGREDSGCEWSNSRMSESGMSADMVCHGKMQGSGTAQVSYAGPEHYSGQYSFAGTMDGQPANMKSTFSGTWVKADCGAVKAAAH